MVNVCLDILICCSFLTVFHRTGSGPCQFSSNKQFLECAPPLPLQWADLYHTWNMAFTSSQPDFIYYLPKLLIPSVRKGVKMINSKK